MQRHVFTINYQSLASPRLPLNHTAERLYLVAAHANPRPIRHPQFQYGNHSPIVILTAHGETGCSQ